MNTNVFGGAARGGSDGAAQPQGQAVPSGSESVVDQNSEFNGRYHSNNNLRIEGKAQGEISCNGTLLIAEQAKVEARIQAQNVTIAGEYTGDVDCAGRFILLPTARAQGRVRAGGLVVQEGALFTGEIRMQDPNQRGTERREPARTGSSRPDTTRPDQPPRPGGSSSFSSLLDDTSNGSSSESRSSGQSSSTSRTTQE